VRDGADHTTDLRFCKSEIFFAEGLDREFGNSARRANQQVFLLPLWEKVAIGGLRPPFFKTPMLCIGYCEVRDG